jgi:hypothetical protein
MTNRTFWIRLFLFGAAFLFLANRLQAQSSVLSFDALPRAAAKADTPSTPGTVKPRSNERVLKDSIARLTRDLAAATARPADTVKLVTVRTDTVWLTLPVVPAAPKSTMNAPTNVAPAPAAAPAFAPPSVTGTIQVQVSGGDAALKSTYRVRRAEIKLVSDLGRKSQGVMMIDVAKSLSLATTGTTTTVTQSSRVLQDAYIAFPFRGTQIEAGQQRLPLSYEGSFGSSTLETIDRALMEMDRARGGSFGDVRDLGVAARGKWRRLDYRAGVYNGSGESMSEMDKNVGKAVVAQLGFKPPFVKGLRLGASGATSGKPAGDKPVRDRVGADLQYNVAGFLLQAEAMRGQDAGVQRGGLNAFVVRSIVPSLKVLARFDAWDPDVHKEGTPATVTERDYLAGFTWLPGSTRLKVQVNIVRKTYTRGLSPAMTQVLSQIQASW